MTLFPFSPVPASAYGPVVLSMPRKFVKVELSQNVTAFADYWDGHAQLNVEVRDKVEDGISSSVSIFLANMSGDGEIDIASLDYEEYSSYEKWGEFVDRVRRELPVVQVMES